MNELGELTLNHVQSSSIGYGRLGVFLAQALRDKGVDVYDAMDYAPEALVRMNGADLKLAEGKRRKRTNAVGWVSVPTHAKGWWEGQWPFVFTMWEATWLPESFRESFHNFECLMVPSLQNLELFGQHHDNVRYVPLGVDPASWHYSERRTPGATFDVLCGGSGGRKGVDVVVRAFAKAFPPGSWGDGPVPRLILKSPKANLGFPDLYRADLPFPPDDRYTVISGRLSPEDEIGLYATAHVYLQPSRGEGFGLQPLQAIAQGLPTILTDAHGHEAFADLGWGVGSELVKAGYFIYGDHPDMKWWEPDVDDCVDHLRDIYENYDDACTFAKGSAEIVAEKFTWANCADHFIEALDGQHLVEPTLTGEWFAPAHKLYLIRVDRPWKADIAGVHYHFEVGLDYWGLSDVKRILFEGGYLDPSCLDNVSAEDGVIDGNGLTADQAAQIGAHDAAKSFCPTCAQQVNSVPTKADILWALSQARHGVDDATIVAGLVGVTDKEPVGA